MLSSKEIEDNRDRLIDLLNSNGCSINNTASEYGCSYQYIQKIIKRYEIKIGKNAYYERR